MKNDNNSKLEVIQQSANLRHQRAAGAFTLSRFNLFFSLAFSPQISWKSTYNFSSYPANKQIDKHGLYVYYRCQAATARP